MTYAGSSQSTSEQITLQFNDSVVVPLPEIDQRLIETIDYIDPAKLAEILAMAEDE